MAELEDQVREKAALAVAQFQDRADGRLDYSESSLLIVEEMLAEAAEFVGQMPQDDVAALIQLFGSYLLQVARTAHGGTFLWHEQQNEPVLVVGEPDRHIAMMAFQKVRGRLSGDESDNIPFFYKGFDDRVRLAMPGTRALYV
jgi:hypothetical protein